VPDAMEITLANNIANAAAQTTLNIKGIIRQMQASGMSKDAIKKTLLTDLQTGGQIFGGFKKKLKMHTSNGIEQAGLFSTLKKYQDKGVEILRWVTIGDDRSCFDCVGRHGEEGTLKYWQAAGLPGSGFSVCGANCRCTFVASGYKGENLEQPLVRKKTKIPSRIIRSVGLREKQIKTITKGIPEDAILLIIVKDHYEAYGNDALFLANTLGVKSTVIDGLAVAGIKVSDKDSMVKKIISAGKKLAILDLGK